MMFITKDDHTAEIGTLDWIVRCYTLALEIHHSVLNYNASSAELIAIISLTSHKSLIRLYWPQKVLPSHDRTTVDVQLPNCCKIKPGHGQYL
jgi:hypothetical protein